MFETDKGLKVEVKEMPTTEVLEEFLAGMLGQEVTVVFDYQEGVFVK